jgi:hypothetical protein
MLGRTRARALRSYSLNGGGKDEGGRRGYRRGRSLAVLSRGAVPHPCKAPPVSATVSKRWRRWSGLRSELVRAAELARDELKVWSGFDSSASVTVSDKRGLTKRGDLSVLSNLHRDEMRRIENVQIWIAPDHSAWRRMLDEELAAGRPALPELIDANVSMRVSDYGTHLEVTGPNETNVEGLAHQRLTPILERGARGKRFLGPPPGVLAFSMTVALFWVAYLVGLAIIRGTGLAARNGRWETAEIVILVAAPLLAIVVGATWWYVTPAIELLDDGQEPRTRRFRGVILFIVATITLGILAALIYDAFA